MFLCDSTRPGPSQIESKRLELAGAMKGIPNCLFDEIQYPERRLSIV